MCRMALRSRATTPQPSRKVPGSTPTAITVVPLVAGLFGNGKKPAGRFSDYIRVRGDAGSGRDRDRIRSERTGGCLRAGAARFSGAGPGGASTQAGRRPGFGGVHA